MRSTRAPKRVHALKPVRREVPASRVIEVRSATNVRTFWLRVREVSRRTEGRSKKQYERYYLGLYLLALADHRLLRYPLKVLEGESPDFMLVGKSGEETGLEITRATGEHLEAAMTSAERDPSDGAAIMASSFGYASDQLEREWCALVRAAMEKKVAELPGFKPAARYDVLVPDDTRMGSGDRRKVIQMLTAWVRELKQREPRLGKISVAASLDVLYDIGGMSLVIPFVEWSSPREVVNGESFSDRVEYAGQFVARNAIRRHKAADGPVYSIDSDGKLVKETSDGRRFEVRVSEAGEESVVQELPRR